MFCQNNFFDVKHNDLFLPCHMHLVRVLYLRYNKQNKSALISELLLQSFFFFNYQPVSETQLYGKLIKILKSKLSAKGKDTFEKD